MIHVTTTLSNPTLSQSLQGKHVQSDIECKCSTKHSVNKRLVCNDPYGLMAVVYPWLQDEEHDENKVEDEDMHTHPNRPRVLRKVYEYSHLIWLCSAGYLSYQGCTMQVAI